jgi:hypothetical protein
MLRAAARLVVRWKAADFVISIGGCRNAARIAGVENILQ